MKGGTFDDYVEEFCDLAADLNARRSAWAAIAPYDDPMGYDEITFRGLEGLVLDDLRQAGASMEQLRFAHCVAQRLLPKPRVRLFETL